MCPRLSAIACVFCMAAAHPAAADSNGGFYANMHGGVNFLSDSDLDIEIPNNPPIDGGLEFSADWAGGAALGYRWSNGFGLEAEATYRNSGLKRQEFMGTSIDIDGDVSSFSGMVNGTYELQTGGTFSPFMGAGIGAASITVDANPGTPDAFKDTDLKPAFQAMGGINYALSQQLSLGVEFVYFAALSPTFHQNGINPSFDYHSQDVFLTLNYSLP